MTYSKKNKTILMLDNEPLMIDRRIILEGKTLVKEGYNVILATRGDGIKPPKEFVGGIEVRRFVDPCMLFEIDGNIQSLQLRLVKSRQIIDGWIYSPGNPVLEASVRSNLFFLPKKLQTFFYALVWPPIMAAILRNRKIGGVLKGFLGRAFEPAIYFLTISPRFLVPYFFLLMGRAKDCLAAMHRTGSSKDITFKGWEFEIEKFSKELRPDVVHVHDLPNLLIGKQISEFLSVPLIYDAHELYPMQYIANEDHRKKLFELEKSLIPFVDAVITVNRQCADFLESTYSIQDVVPLSNATESPDGFNPSEPLRLWHKRFDLSDNVKIIVFQGGINPIRNIDQLIKALAELPDFIHVGFITYSKDVKYYEDLSRELGVFDRIHYVIEIPWDQVVYWLASSDVGIMPYQATNYNAQISSPNKLYEFVVAGIPIIGSTELINVKLAIEQDGLGLSILLRGVDSYIRVIMNMFDHPEGPNRFKKNVLIARSHYTWSSEEQKLIALYSRICDQAYRPKALRVKGIRNVPCAE